MEIQDILKHFFPKEIIAYFNLVDIKEDNDELVICLEEKNSPPTEHSDKQLESKGFLPAIYLQDFPIRNHAVHLKIRRRKWRDKLTSKTYTTDWKLKYPGTSYTLEFAAFLKKMY